MNKQDILKALKNIDLDKDEIIIISGASLVVQGLLDKTNDIDLTCSKKYYESINWPTKIGAFNKEIKYYNNIEIGYNLYDLENVIVINGYKFMNIKKILEIKKLLNRTKDKKIINVLELEIAKKDKYIYEKDLIKKGISLIAGVDEVGRGPLVGPVVACACILPINYKLKGLNDSKKLSEKKREELYQVLIRDAISYGIGIIDAKKIDEVNIYEATKLAMISAIENLNVKPEHILVDAMKLDLDIPTTPIIKGDFKSLSIAAASIIAKVTRDNMMIELDKKYPMYGFLKHKGYPTKKHLSALAKYGPLENYRFTYGPVRDLILEEGSNEHETINQ